MGLSAWDTVPTHTYIYITGPGQSMLRTQLQILDLPVLELNPLNIHLFFFFSFYFPPAKRVLSTRSSKS